MLEVGLALRPQVDDDVEESAAGAAHELGFGCRRKLEMHAPHRAACLVVGDAGLDKTGFMPCSSNSRRAKAAGEKTSFVLAPFQLDDEGACEFGLGENHGGSLGGLRPFGAHKAAPVPQVGAENSFGHQTLDMRDALIARSFELFEQQPGRPISGIELLGTELASHCGLKAGNTRAIFSKLTR